MFIPTTRTHYGKQYSGKSTISKLPTTKDINYFAIIALFDFESICVPTEELKIIETTTWIGKHVPTSVSVFSSLQDDPILLCEKDPELLIIAFVSNLELLAEKHVTNENQVSRN